MADRTPIIVGLIIIVFVALVGFSLQSGYMSNRVEISPTHIVYQDGGTIYVINGHSMSVMYSSSNATQSMQYALNQSGYIFVKAGNYTIDGTLTLLSTTTIEGSGQNTTYLTMSVDVDCDFVVADLQHNIVLRDLTLNQQRNNTHSDSINGLYFSNSSFITLDSVTIQNGARYNLRIRNCSNVHVETCRFLDVGHDDSVAIEYYSHDVWVQKCYVDGHREYTALGQSRSGIEIDDYSHRVFLTDTVIRNMPDNGIEGHLHFGDAASQIQDVFIFNNYIEEIDGRGINFAGNITANELINRITISGNTIVNCTTRGISVHHVNNSVIVANNLYNTARNASQTALFVSDSPGTIVDSNTVSGFTERGIAITTCTNIVVSDNYVADGPIGIQLRMQSVLPQYTVVSGNILENVTTGIYTVKTTDVTISNNIITTKETGSPRGIRLDEGSHTITIANNLFSDYAYFYINDAHTITVVGNLFGGNVYLEHTNIANVLFEGNTFSGAVLIEATVDHIYFDNNQLGANGIYIPSAGSGSEYIYVTNNVFRLYAKYNRAINIPSAGTLINHFYIEHNVFLGNTQTDQIGIYSRGGDDWVIKNNIFRDFDDAYEIAMYFPTLPTNLVVKHNEGFTTENTGVAQNVANGGTIAHGLAGTPDVVLLTSCNATYDGDGVCLAWDVANTGSINISIDLYWCNGTAISDSVIWVSWEAFYVP